MCRQLQWCGRYRISVLGGKSSDIGSNIIFQNIHTLCLQSFYVSNIHFKMEQLIYALRRLQSCMLSITRLFLIFCTVTITSQPSIFRSVASFFRENKSYIHLIKKKILNSIMNSHVIACPIQRLEDHCCLMRGTMGTFNCFLPIS